MTQQNQLLTTFKFSVKLRKASQIKAGSNLASNSSLTSDNTEQNGNDALGDGGFQECSGLEISMDVQEYLEGGRNDGVIQRVGRAKYSNIVLKRGMFYSMDKDNPDAQKQINRDLWEWLQNVVAGTRPVLRYDGIIEAKTSAGDVVATWVFERGLPVKIVGPQLNAKTGDIAIEEMHIAHEGLRLKAG